MSAKERQAAYRARLREKFQTQVNLMVHVHQVAGLNELAIFLRQHPELVCDGAMLRDMRTGRLRKVK